MPRLASKRGSVAVLFDDPLGILEFDASRGRSDLPQLRDVARDAIHGSICSFSCENRKATPLVWRLGDEGQDADAENLTCR